MSERRLHVFDLDDTLVPGVLAERAFWKLADAGYVNLPDEQLVAMREQRAVCQAPNGSFPPEADAYVWGVVEALIEGTRGLDIKIVRKLAQELADQDAQAIYPIMKDLLEQIDGHTDQTAIISGSIEHFVHPLARRLGITISTGSRFFVGGGTIHKYRNPEHRHSNKERLVQSMARSLGATAYAGYGDSMRDFSMLLAVQHPHAVNPSPELRTEAQTRGWPIIEVSPAGSEPVQFTLPSVSD